MSSIVLFDPNRRKGNAAATNDTPKKDTAVTAEQIPTPAETAKTNIAIYDGMTHDYYRTLVNELQGKPVDDKCGIAHARLLARRVLEDGGHSEISGTIPITDIATKFGFACYQAPDMEKNISGKMYVGGTTRQIYEADKSILVSNRENAPRQRFIIAHELGHYLMDYLGSGLSRDWRKLYAKKYPDTPRDLLRDARADEFAAELLMPMRMFVRRYARLMQITNYDPTYAIPNLSRHFGMEEKLVKEKIHELYS